MRTVVSGVAAILMASAATPALAQSYGGPTEIGDGVTLDPIVDLRLRYESVDQPAKDADALTLRLRGGFELKASDFSILIEGEGTGSLLDHYDAFPFTVPNEGQDRPGYSVVADPDNIELNRAQIAWSKGGNSVTLGRQRINLDDQRWVGSVGWRQNEQTFDAVRGIAKLGPVTLDGTYAISQRTIFGIDAGPRQAYDGDFIFLGAGVKAGPVALKGFAYLIDYDDPLVAASSSQTYGVLATTSFELAPKVKLGLKASYANQSDWKTSAKDYNADYLALEGNLSAKGFTLTGGYELLGSDNGVGLATPMATLHKFNGWADVFLNTPGGGLEDIYGGIAYSFPSVKVIPGLKASVTYHEFNSDKGGLDYGSEWDASLGFKLGPVGILAKYANYDAGSYGTDTEKFWLQAEYSF
ncbi:MAG: alginate export family protein [Novosphingobium sp.]|nr:alginate export family protein [Novosphingobium sp.]